LYPSDAGPVVPFGRFLASAVAALALLVGVLQPSSVSAAPIGAYVGSAVVPGGSGYWLVTARGEVDAFDGAQSYGDMGGAALNRPVITMASTSTGKGYWLVASDGGIFAFGDAAFFGSTGHLKLNSPVVGMTATASGAGYWMVAADGGIFAFGDAAFFGSTGHLKLNSPVVGMTATASGAGYWMVAADGGIFAFGDAAFHGSTGGMNLNRPVVAMAPTVSGNGYWLAASDGGIFAFGDATFRGSGAGRVSGTIVAFIPDATGGYVIVDSTGTVLRFAGPAANVSSAGNTPPAIPTMPSGPGSTTSPSINVPTNPSNPTTSTPPNGNPSNGDLNGWKYIFGDDFNVDAAEGSFLSKYRNWGAYDTGWPDTSRKGMYDTNILSVSNNTLNMRLHTGADGKPRASVPFPLINGRNAPDATNQLYGRYEVRFRADQVPGYKTAFLLWPKSEVWPRDGEIDFPEGDLTGDIWGFMHRQGATSGGDQDWFSTGESHGVWHTAVTEWSPNAVRFYLNGRLVGTSTTRIPNTPMHWVLQTETTLGNSPVPPTASGYVQFDYVKVWSYSPSTVAG
jgi:hypothetical protein